MKPPPRTRAIVGWSLYDLANTIFYLLVVTLYLPRQMGELAGNERAFAWANLVAMAVSAALSPALGAIVDRAGRARALTLAITLVCCVATASLGLATRPLMLGLVYAVARFAYEMASVPYNALLPSISGATGTGHVSGLGVALGYAGNVVAIATIRATNLDDRGFGAVYLLAAAMFFGFTLPLRFWVPEAPAARPGTVAARDVLGAVLATWRAMRRQFSDRARCTYLLGTLLVCDAVNTVLAQVGRYAQRPEGLGLAHDGGHGDTWFLLAVQSSAIAGGYLFGRGADRRGGRATTIGAVALVALGLVCAQWLPWFWPRVVAMGLFGGAGVAGVWSAGRQWLLELVPRDEVGEAFGFYGLVQRASFVTLVPFTVLFDRTGSYTTSVALLLLFLAGGTALLVATPRRRVSAP